MYLYLQVLVENSPLGCDMEHGTFLKIVIFKLYSVDLKRWLCLLVFTGKTNHCG